MLVIYRVDIRNSIVKAESAEIAREVAFVDNQLSLEDLPWIWDLVPNEERDQDDLDLFHRYGQKIGVEIIAPDSWVSFDLFDEACEDRDIPKKYLPYIVDDCELVSVRIKVYYLDKITDDNSLVCAEP